MHVLVLRASSLRVWDSPSCCHEVPVVLMLLHVSMEQPIGYGIIDGLDGGCDRRGSLESVYRKRTVRVLNFGDVYESYASYAVK